MLRRIIVEHLLLLKESTGEEIYNKYYKGKLPQPYGRPFTGWKEQEVFNMICVYDPTTEASFGKIKRVGKYSKWLLKLFIEKKLLGEDLYKGREYLKIFDSNKQALKREGKDINIMNYHSLPSLYSVIEPFIEDESEDDEHNLSNTQVIKKIKEQETIRFYENNEWLIVIPETKRSACLYGKGTQWCTAASKSDNMFDYYVNEEYPDSHLYIFINKNRPSDKYQCHIQSGQFMNTNDEAINPRRVVDDIDIWYRILKNETELGMFEPKKEGNIYYIEFKKLSELAEIFEYPDTIKEIFNGEIEPLCPYRYAINPDDYTQYINPDNKNMIVKFGKTLDIEMSSHINFTLDDILEDSDIDKIDYILRNCISKTIGSQLSRPAIKYIKKLFNEFFETNIETTDNGYRCVLTTRLLLHSSGYYNHEKFFDERLGFSEYDLKYPPFDSKLFNYYLKNELSQII